ncbi:hypothetical protein ACIBL6_15800 [Streptomyces sp. NPDC050400]|uniref:hypothetical protein n=1 Tax=Streptomyces sp. NPDC050400 TaxID=3365610 RepID=UPI00378C1B9F
MDDMLDAKSLYWFTNSAASSGRIYWENKTGSFVGPKLALPVAVTVFPRDIPRLPRSWIEDTYSNLIHYGETDKGGLGAELDGGRVQVAGVPQCDGVEGQAECGGRGQGCSGPAPRQAGGGTGVASDVCRGAGEETVRRCCHHAELRW